jgi:Carboxypeptidase regulatory-like domain
MKRRQEVLWLLMVVLLLNGLALGQGSKKETQLRTVRGLVTDKADQPIKNGVVFLKNSRTGMVISHFTDDEGNYRFTGLDPNVDYEVYGEFDGQRSGTRSVSPLDSRKEIILNLKVDKKKG